MVHGNECCGRCQSFEMQAGGAEGEKCAFGVFVLENNQNHALWENPESFLSLEPEL